MKNDKEKKTIEPKIRLKEYNIWHVIISVIIYISNIILLLIMSGYLGKPQQYIADCIILAGITITFSIPIIARWNAYWTRYNPNGFSAAFVEREYKLRGWMKGKYKFYDAILSRVNGEFVEARLFYVSCLNKADKENLRRACYVDMARHMPNQIEIIPILKKGFEEFPDEHIIFNRVANYYIVYEFASREEGTEWFKHIAETCELEYARSLSYQYLGRRYLYNGEYSIAKEYLLKSLELCYEPIFPDCYFYLAICEICLGNFDSGREFAVKAVACTYMSEYEDSYVNPIENLKEAFDYMFRVQTGEINLQSEKMIKELERRATGKESESVNLDEISEI